MKYQLNVFWKDGSISGRVIEIPWALRQDPKNARVELQPYEPPKTVAVDRRTKKRVV